MAGRKKDNAAFQVEIETQEEWEAMLTKQGLTVVDVYQKWCGPCKALESIFKKVKLETGSDLLNFAVAKADTVDALESYQGRCETCLLFYAGGKLVNVMRGVNAPLLVRTLVSELNKETRVIAGDEKRKSIVDTGATMNTSVNLDETMEEEQDSQKEAKKSVPEDQQKKEVTLAIIKPDVINDGKLQDILDEIAAAGIKILETQRKILSEEEVNLLYPSLQNEEYFDDIVKYLMSGDSQIMVLCKMGTEKGIVDVWQNMIGPMDSSIAKEEACDSLRAKYGTDKITNGLHGSDSIASANREVACFFPDFDRYSSDKPADESATHPDKKTLAVIRPDALEEYKDAILARITEAGFEVTDQKEMHLSTEQAEKFYKCHQEAPFYGELVNLMSSGPSLFLLLTKDDAVNEWRELIGPTDPATAKLEASESLRALYGQDTVKNAVHGCSCDDEATDHIDQIFGDELGPTGEGGTCDQEEERCLTPVPTEQSAENEERLAEETEQQSEQEPSAAENQHEECSTNEQVIAHEERESDSQRSEQGEARDDSTEEVSTPP